MVECKDSCGSSSSRYRLKISEDEVFFGTILVGNTSPTFEITLENLGWEDILFQSLSITGPFTLVRTNCPDVLKPGQKGRINVTFNPTSFGPWTGAVFIMAGRAGDHNIRLIGAGYNSNENGNDLSGIPIFLTRADLEDNANLVYPNGAYAFVVSDEILINNDFYQKTGDSGLGGWGEPLGKLGSIVVTAQASQVAAAASAASALASKNYIDAVLTTAFTPRIVAGTTDTLVIGDNGRPVKYTNVGVVTVTIPTNATVAFPIGASVPLYNYGGGTLQVVGAVGVTIVNDIDFSPSCSRQYAPLFIQQLSANEWVCTGSMDIA